MGLHNIVRTRLKEICPKEKLEDLDVLEVKCSCIVAFKIIGYEPENLEESFQKTWESLEDAEWLWQFVYEVWRCDK